MSHWSVRRPVNGLLLMTVVVTLSSLLAACGRAPARTPDVFVIVSSATANEPAPQLAADNRGPLEQAGATSTQAEAYVVDPATGQPADVPLTPRRADGQVEYGPSRGYLLSQNVDRVQQLLRGEAAAGPFDLLGLIASAVRVASPPGTLLIVSSGLSTAGGFDLRQVGWDADPGSVANQLKQRGLLPGLAGWHVVFSGLGTRPAPSPHFPSRSGRRSLPTGWPYATPRERLPAVLTR
jgi:hypothetical protein